MLNNHFVAGQYNPLTNTVELNNVLLSMPNNQLKKTLLHELQHNIQKIEKFSMGSSGQKGLEEYKSNLGEIESRDTASREKLDEKERLKIQPKILLTETKNIEKQKNSLYNLNREIINEKNTINDKRSYSKKNNGIKRPIRVDRNVGGKEVRIGEELENSSFSMEKMLNARLQNFLDKNIKIKTVKE